MSDLTQEELKRLFYYDPETGDFIRRVNVGSRARAGDTAGSYKQGYKSIRINYKEYGAHRLAFLYVEGKFPENRFQIDHIDHRRDNNRWCNLRIVTHKENGRNCSMLRTNKSGFVGVSWHEPLSKWRATIVIDGKSKHLGVFQSKVDAIAARMAANKKFGFHANHGKQRETA